MLYMQSLSCELARIRQLILTKQRFWVNGFLCRNDAEHNRKSIHHKVGKKPNLSERDFRAKINKIPILHNAKNPQTYAGISPTIQYTAISFITRCIGSIPVAK